MFSGTPQGSATPPVSISQPTRQRHLSGDSSSSEEEHTGTLRPQPASVVQRQFSSTSDSEFSALSRDSAPGSPDTNIHTRQSRAQSPVSIISIDPTSTEYLRLLATEAQGREAQIHSEWLQAQNKVAELQDQIRQLKEQEEQQLTSIDRLNRELEEVNTKYAQLMESTSRRVSELKARWHEAQDQYARKKEELEQMIREKKAECEQLQQALEDEKKALTTAHQSQLQVKNSEMADLNRRLTNRQEEYQNLQRQHHLTKQLLDSETAGHRKWKDQAKKNADQLKSVSKQLKSVSEQLKSANEELKSTSEQHREHMEQWDEMVTLYQNSEQALKAARDALTDKAAQQEKQDASYNAQSAELLTTRNQLAEYKEAKVMLEGKIGQLQDQLQSKTEEYLLTQSRVTQLEEQQASLKTQHEARLGEEIQNQKEALESQQQSHRQVANALSARVVAAELQAGLSREERDTLKKQFEQAVESHQQILENLQSELQAKDRLLQQQTQAIRLLQEQNQQLTVATPPREKPPVSQPCDAVVADTELSSSDGFAVTETLSQPSASLVPAIPPAQAAPSSLEEMEADTEAVASSSPASGLPVMNSPAPPFRMPESIADLFRNARDLEIPQYFVSLGYPVRKGKDGHPVEITSRSDILNPMNYPLGEERRILTEIETEYTTVDEGRMPTPIQQEGVQNVWYQASFLETFIQDIEGLQHWIGLPHDQLVAKLRAMKDTDNADCLSRTEIEMISQWRDEQNNDEEAKNVTTPFWPIDWLSRLATETRNNPRDKLTQLAGCWADFSIQLALAGMPAQRKKFRNNPFNWRQLDLPGDAGPVLPEAGCSDRTGDRELSGGSGKRKGKGHTGKGVKKKKMH